MRKRFNNKEYDLVFSTQKRKGLLLMAIRRLDIQFTARRRKRFINKDLINRNKLEPDLKGFDANLSNLIKAFKNKKKRERTELLINA